MRSEWPSLTVGDLVRQGEATIQTGPFGSQLHSQDYVAVGTPVIPTEAIGRGRIRDVDVPMVGATKANELSRHRLHRGDILFARRGAQATGLSAIVDERYEGALCGTGALLLRMHSGRVNPDYLAMFLSSDFAYDWLRAHAVGAVMPNLNTEIIKALQLVLPPIDEQRELAKFFDALDDRIALLRETNATLESIAQALFKSWFVDFDPVRAKCQGLAPAGMDEATAALFADGFEESVLGPIPASWCVAMLGELTAYLNRGMSPKYLESGGIRVINQRCIRDFAVDVAKARRHDDAQKSSAGRELEVGDILVNSTGVGTLGRVAQVLALDETTIVDSHVTVARAGERVTWNFLGLAMMRRQAEIEGLGEGSTGQTELSRGKLSTLLFVVPPEAVLRAFDSSIFPLRMSMSANAQQVLTLVGLRDTLLPRLISGQLRLPEADALAAANQPA